MKDSELKYRDLLTKKLENLEKLHQNLILQEKAIKDEYDNLMIDLLDESRKFIDAINEINDSIKNIDIENCCNNENFNTSKLIKLKTEKIYKIYSQNYSNAKEFIEELKSTIKQINLGKKAILNGYLKRQQQQYGYFIDKRVGKSYKY